MLACVCHAGYIRVYYGSPLFVFLMLCPMSFPSDQKKISFLLISRNFHFMWPKHSSVIYLYRSFFPNEIHGLFFDELLFQLLSRVFNILRENNPELAGDRRRTVMRPPQVLREGTKKTVFVNFMDLCKTYVYLYYFYHLHARIHEEFISISS